MARTRDRIERVTRAVEMTGTAIIVLGAFGSLAAFAVGFVRRGGREEPINAFRSSLGRSILLALEFLVAADIVNTVAIEGRRPW